MKGIAIMYGAVVSLMTLDVMSGVVRTIATKRKLSSAKMFSGLCKKSLSIILMAAVDVIYHVSTYYGMHMPDVRQWVMWYIISMEAVSIAENCKDGGLTDIINRIVSRIGGMQNDNQR